MEGKKKNNSRDSVLISLLVVVAVITFIGGYVLSGDLSERSFRATKTDNTKEEVVISDDVVRGRTIPTIDTLGFKKGNVVSVLEKKYEVNFGRYTLNTKTYFDLGYGDTTKTVKLVRHDSNGEFEEYLLDFNYDVVDIFVGSFGNTKENDTIFFLLDDGTVEYIVINEAVENNIFETLQITSVSNVAKFYNGNVCDKEGTTCVETAYAQTMDGSIYDLYDFIIQ